MATPYRTRAESSRELATVAPRALGRLSSVHTTGTTVRRTLIATGSIAAVLCAMTLAWPGAIGFVVMAFLFATVVALWVGIALFLGLDVTVEVHENGLRVDRSAHKPVSIAFDEIAALYTKREAEWVVELASGRRVTLPMKVGKRRRLEAAVEQEIERPILADAVHALQSGDPLTFASVTLELDGIRHRGDLIAWSDIDHVRVDDDAMVFVHKGTHHVIAALPMSAIQFPRVLVALLVRRTDVIVDDPFWTRFV